MKLADWRNAAGLTQEELADKIGLTPLSIARYENGTRVPIPTVMRQLYELSGGSVTPNDFYALPDIGARAAA